MKKILRIAKLELNILFFSPIAWFLLIVFLFQCGLAYTSVIKSPFLTQQLGGFRLQFLRDLTAQVFTGKPGLFPQVLGRLYLFLPLLTMGLMSREISGGTIKLLYSSPIKIREIVFGKFVSMMIYNLLLVLILLIFVLTGLFDIKSPDAGPMFTSLLGIYLLLCAYAAIGLFMSCLTSYQVVAALSTLVLLGALSYVGTLWQDVDFVRDLTNFLSINGRTQHMLLGLITTKDILYYIVIVYFFLGFSILKLQGDRESTTVWVKAGRYAAIVVTGLAIGYMSGRPGLIGYVDVSAGKQMTLTPNAQEILKETGDAPIEVTSYINLLDNTYSYGKPDQRNMDMQRWEPYLRFKSNIHFKYVYYYDSTYADYFYKFNKEGSIPQIAAHYTKTMGVDLHSFLTPGQIRAQIDLRPESNQYVMQLDWKGKKTFLRLFDDPQIFPGEMETSAAIKRLLVSRLPKVLFLTGELERDIHRKGDKEYNALASQKSFRYSLINQGFDVDTISLETGDIPDSIAALVVADPRVSFDTVVLSKLHRYIASGGNLLIAGEPGKQELLNPLLRDLGVQMTDGTLIQPSRDFEPDQALPLLTSAAGDYSKGLKAESRDSGKISMPGAAALSYRPDGPFETKPLLVTDPRWTWNKKGDYVPDSAAVTYNAEGGDVKGAFPTALQLTRTVGGRQQRIIVAGDADFLSTGAFKKSRQLETVNFAFCTGLFGWFADGEFPVDASRPRSKDNRVNLTDSRMTLEKIFFLGVLPGLLLVFGTVLLIRRKRQ